MGHVYYKIWIHLVWSAKNRYPFLNDEIRHKIFKHISDNAEEKGFFIDMINGYTDHCHVLISLNPKYAISEVVNNFKGEASHWINSEKLTTTHFAWQEGYSAFSVSESQVEKVRNYIKRQEEHNKKQSLVVELKKLFELHNIEFDEKYLL